jgi:hypothetical protein
MARWSPTGGVHRPPPSGVAIGLGSLADAISSGIETRRDRQERDWRAEIDERRYQDGIARQDRAFQQQLDQYNATRRDRRQANAAAGIADELDDRMAEEDVEQFDPGTGEWLGVTKRWEAIGPGLGYRDITTTDRYRQGRSAFDARERQEAQVQAAVSSGLMSEEEARALAAGGGNALADVLEAGAKLPFDLKRDQQRFDNQERLAIGADERRFQREMARLREEAQLRERLGGGAGASNTDLKDRESVISRQIDDARAELGVAGALDPYTGEMVDPERYASTQHRLDSLNVVRDNIASAIGGGAFQPRPSGQQTSVPAIVSQAEELKAKREMAIQGLMREMAIQALIERGVPPDQAVRQAADQALIERVVPRDQRDQAVRQADQAYSQSIAQLYETYGPR